MSNENLSKTMHKLREETMKIAEPNDLNLLFWRWPHGPITSVADIAVLEAGLAEVQATTQAALAARSAFIAKNQQVLKRVVTSAND